jgi:hypothetical protein
VPPHPVHPGHPVEPVHPANPGHPVEPAHPIEPANPVNPAHAIGPAHPLHFGYLVERAYQIIPPAAHPNLHARQQVSRRCREAALARLIPAGLV